MANPSRGPLWWWTRGPGACAPGARAAVGVDTGAGCLAEAGDLLMAIAEGHFAPERIHAEIGEIAAGERPGRRDPAEVTLFKSVGTAALDVAVGAAALQRAAGAGARPGGPLFNTAWTR